MEPNQDRNFQSRPIILSPPPLSSTGGTGTSTPQKTEDSKLQEFLSSGHFQRQQSVGYNLQHEFETLNADLDLDLKDPTTNSRNTNNSGNSGVSMVNSPIPTNINGSQAGLGSLLNQSFYSPLNLPNRPQTVTDFSLSGQASNLQNFYLELVRFTNWIENLNPQDNVAMIDYLCSNLPLDILLSFRSKLDQHLNGNNINSLVLPQLLAQNQPLSLIMSPYAYGQPNQSSLGQNPHTNELLNDLDNLNLNDDRALQHPKPRQNGFRQGFPSSLAGVLGSRSRPRSADPTLQPKNEFNPNQYQNNGLNSNFHYLDRSKSPTGHMFEKTNFLQLAAGSSPGLVAQQNQDDYESLDMSQKLGALATINSRVALDSNKKNFYQNHYDPSNRAINSNSVPVGGNKVKSPNQKARKEVSMASTPVTPTTSSNSSMPADVANIDLLNNIPAWLKLLRLHKYTECLKDIPWTELIELNDEQLEDRGVKALGARRKLLKAFDVIKSQI